MNEMIRSQRGICVKISHTHCVSLAHWSYSKFSPAAPPTLPERPLAVASIHFPILSFHYPNMTTFASSTHSSPVPSPTSLSSRSHSLVTSSLSPFLYLCCLLISPRFLLLVSRWSSIKQHDWTLSFLIDCTPILLVPAIPHFNCNIHACCWLSTIALVAQWPVTHVCLAQLGTFLQSHVVYHRALPGCRYVQKSNKKRESIQNGVRYGSVRSSFQNYVHATNSSCAQEKQSRTGRVYAPEPPKRPCTFCASCLLAT